MPQQNKDRSKFKAEIFNAIADPVRLKMLEFLRTDEKCVCEIVPHVRIIQPVVSRHLKILKDCGLVKDRKDGTRRLYSITDPKIFNVLDAATPELIASLSRHIIEQLT